MWKKIEKIHMHPEKVKPCTLQACFNIVYLSYIISKNAFFLFVEFAYS